MTSQCLGAGGCEVSEGGDSTEMSSAGSHISVDSQVWSWYCMSEYSSLKNQTVWGLLEQSQNLDIYINIYSIYSSAHFSELRVSLSPCTYCIICTCAKHNYLLRFRKSSWFELKSVVAFGHKQWRSQKIKWSLFEVTVDDCQCKATRRSIRHTTLCVTQDIRCEIRYNNTYWGIVLEAKSVELWS